MTDVFGWCIPCKMDVRASSDGSRYCAGCGHILIPPSWGDRRWQWTDGTWEPYKPRPEGWHWVQPVDGEPKAVKPKPAPPVKAPSPTPVPRSCSACNRERPLRPSGRCKSCHERVLRRAHMTTPEPRPCRDCGEVYQPVAPPMGGPASPYCGKQCRRAARNRRNAAWTARRRREAAA